MRATNNNYLLTIQWLGKWMRNIWVEMGGTHDKKFAESPRFVVTALGTIQVDLFPKIFASFSIFSRWRGKHSFLENCSTNSRFVYRLWSRYSSSTKKVCGMNGGCRTTLVSIFHVENVSPGKTEKNVKYLRQHSTDIHQVFAKIIDVSFHQILITDCLENIGQGQNLQTCSFLIREYF